MSTEVLAAAAESFPTEEGEDLKALVRDMSEDLLAIVPNWDSFLSMTEAEETVEEMETLSVEALGSFVEKIPSRLPVDEDGGGFENVDGVVGRVSSFEEAELRRALPLPLLGAAIPAGMEGRAESLPIEKAFLNLPFIPLLSFSFVTSVDNGLAGPAMAVSSLSSSLSAVDRCR